MTLPDSHQLKETGNRFLLLVRMGRYKFYEAWVDDPKRRFDVFLSCYDTGVEPVVGEGVFFEHRPGKKVEGISAVLKEHPNLCTDYEYIGIFDEDLEISATDLNTVFELAAEKEFKISQPSLTHDSYFSYAAFLQNKSFEYRCVNFIEMMCPVFRADILKKVSKIYDLSYETGIDLLWCNFNNPMPDNYAVIDKVAVRHTQPVGGKKEENGFSGQTEYIDEIYNILDEYEVNWYQCVPYFGSKNIRKIDGRLDLLFRSLRILPAVWKKRPFKPRLRMVLRHWKHLVFEKPANENSRLVDVLSES